MSMNPQQTGLVFFTSKHHSLRVNGVYLAIKFMNKIIFSIKKTTKTKTGDVIMKLFKNL